ncbi:MAG: hypothetical protein ACRCS3_05280 [Paracoccaceae bacterium]
MKLNFALNLTDDKISLLHRSGQNWNEIGSADFGADDMDDRLADMLAAASAKAPKGVATKIVIPNSQILYIRVPVTGSTDAARRAEITAALAGRTPYAVDDLVFDYAGEGPEVQVAVLAKETLDQAEEFAVGYKFRPVGFVGIPAAEDFAGEPHFGLTKFAPSVLGKGRRMEWDTAPVAWADSPEVADEVAAVAVDAFPETNSNSAIWPEEDAVPARPAEPEPETLAPEPVVPKAEVPESSAPAAPMPEAEVLADTAAPVVAEPVLTEPAVSAPEMTAPEVQQPVAGTSEQDPVRAERRFAGVAAPSVQAVDEAPFAEVSDTDTAASTDDEIPPAPSTAALMAFASRRAATAGTSPPVERTMPPAPIADRMAARAQVNMRPEPRVTISPAVTAPVAAPGKKQRKAMTTGAAPAATTTIPPSAARKPLTKPGGTFGSSAPVRGKPRFLGLILTGILILFLALLAAWSSFFLASQNDPAVEPATAVAANDVPDITDEALADGQDIEPLMPDAPAENAVPPETAVADALLPEAVVSDTDIAAGPEPAVEPEAEIATTEPAGPAPETGVVTTGPAPIAPDAEPDEILLSTADSPLALQEAANLAAPELLGDAAPTPQMAPPPFGTVYEFNANGTVRAVPEGIMTPDGVRLVAGEPSSVPPARPAAIAAAAAAAAAAAEVTPPVAEDTAVVGETAGVDDTTVVGSDPALADARPRARPEGLVVPNPDDAALQTDGPVLASSPRPLRRPESVTAAGAAVELAAEEAARATDAASLAAASAAAGTAAEAIIQDLAATAPATAPEGLTPSGSRLAVSVSRIPAPRPRDMERAVAAALEAATRAPAPEPEPEPEPQQVAAATPEEEPEPEVEAPVASAPTSGSVADRATFVNAINLSQMNLIGVYGSESNRYALIRQSNGRYKKVTVGDRIDGGVIQAITSNEVRYQKGGRLLALQMPDT